MFMFRSRSEQAPGSGLQPSDKSVQIDCEFWGPSWFDEKVNQERWMKREELDWVGHSIVNILALQF